MAEANTAARLRTNPTTKSFSHPLIELTLLRVREFLRQPEAVFWTFAFPVLMACALGLAFRNSAPQKMRIVIATTTERAAELAAKLSQTPTLDAVVMSADQAAQDLRTGKIALIVQGTANQLEYRFDPTRPDSQIARLAVNDALQRALGRADVATTTDQTHTEPGARYIDFLIPGLLGLNLMSSGLWGLGFTLVLARTQKRLKRLAATPMKRWHYLLSFILSRLVFLVVELVFLFGFAYLVFGVKVQGSIVTTTLLAVLGAMSFSGIGLLIAARPLTIEGVSGWINLVMMPMWLLSGTFFSASRFPDFLQPIIRALPLTALNDALRAVINEGTSLGGVTLPITIICAWGLVSFLVALKIFRWQ